MNLNQVTELTADNFEEWKASNPKAIIDVWAPWCGPCKAFSPVFKEESSSHQDVAFGMLNADAEPKLAQLLKVRSLPTLIGLKNGQIENTQIGIIPVALLRKQISELY